MSPTIPKLIGAIEGGGTKFVCAVGTDALNISHSTTIPTTTPQETLQKCLDFFLPFKKDLISLGIGCFGPIDLKPTSPTYGHILNTPKKHWSQSDVVVYFSRKLGVPIAWDTDVNAAALGEWEHGAGQNCNPLVYITVGTGVGGAVIVQGDPIHGALHPEMGHILIPQDPSDDFPGICPFHGNCLEGLASGTAIAERWKKPGQKLSVNPEVWELEATYLAHAVLNLSMILSPERIILGGGVMQQTHLHQLVHQKYLHLSQNYALSAINRAENYLSAPFLGNRAGICGVMVLASRLNC